MKPNLILFLASLTAAARVCAQTVMDNGPELIITGQFDSGGTPDIAIVDKQTGQVRTGLDNGASLTWSGPLLSGLADVTGVTSGRVGLPLNEGLILISSTGNAAARVSPLDGSSPPVVYPYNVAPSCAVALDYTGNSPVSNTNGLWLVSGTYAPSAFPEVINLVTPNSAVLTATAGAQGSADVLMQGQRARFTSAGNVLAAFAAPAAGRVYVFQSFATGIPALPWRPQLTADFAGLPVGVQFTHEYLLPGGQAMFLFIAPGNANVYYAPAAAGPTVNVSTLVATGIAVGFIVPVNAPGAQGFIAFPDGAGPAKFFVWNGSAFELRQSIAAPAGGRWTGALPGAALKLLHGPATGGGTSGWQHWPLQGNGQFALSGSGAVPPRIVSISAHVFAFTQEPFVSPLTVMTDARRVADWTSGALALPGTRVMNVTRETYAGTAAGLGAPAAFNAGTAPAGSAWMLTNQYAPDISIAALSSAKITLNEPEVTISPAPQHRVLTSLTPAVSETITFSAAAGVLVFYRTSASQAFQLYSAATPPVISVTTLPQSSTVEYFAQAGGVRSRLHLAAYTFGSSAALSVPAATDSDGDGLADSWENYYGLTDPNGDPDADGMNNLTEQNSGSDPLGPCQPGELPELSLSISGGTIAVTFTRALVPGEQFQSSTDLVSWENTAIPSSASTYSVPAGAVRRYFRIQRP